MILVKDVTTPSNTAKANAIRNQIAVFSGLVYRVEIEFPHGAAGLHHIQIYDGGHPLYPSNPDGSFHSNGEVIAFDDVYLKRDVPYSFSIFSWNLDDTYDHFSQVRIGMLTEPAFMARYMPELAVDQQIQRLAELQASQNEVIKQAGQESLDRLTGGGQETDG